MLRAIWSYIKTWIQANIEVFIMPLGFPWSVKVTIPFTDKWLVWSYFKPGYFYTRKKYRDV